jgi:hypothetical protein
MARQTNRLIFQHRTTVSTEVPDAPNTNRRVVNPSDRALGLPLVPYIRYLGHPPSNVRATWDSDDSGCFLSIWLLEFSMAGLSFSLCAERRYLDTR